jgi:hypothetical protein
MAYAIERTIWSCMVAPNQRLSLRVNCEEVYRVYIKDEAEGGDKEFI